MADENGSRLLTNSEDLRTCSLAKNSAGYTPAKEYCAGSSDTLSDGDNKGRDPESAGGTIGTAIDIKMRDNLLAKNADRYTPGNEYCAGSPDTLSDGDMKGRDPESNGGSIGTTKDIEMRSKLMAKNADGYTYGNEYCAGVADTVADGDGKGREPENGGEAGTCIDMLNRSRLMAKNSNLYTKSKQYGFGNGTV